jgi:predicted KAP-like P-loop ATPase
VFDDRPIQTAAEDRLGRVHLSESIARDLQRPASMVAAVIGPWGSGKTSVLNLVKFKLAADERTVLVEFNPWFFSGTEQLIAHFFAEFAAQLRTEKEKSREAIAQRLDSYSRVLEPIMEVPVVGGWVKALRGGAAIGSQAARRGSRFGRPGLREERRALEDALNASELRFLVVVDDIDRLQSEEIRDVVRLVRLVGELPRTTYLLAFDRRRVEEALGGNDPGLGRDYLEKIVQVMYSLPRPSREELVRLTFDSLARSIEGLDARPLDDRHWPNVLNRVIAPLIRTPRDATRYANAVPSVIRAVGTEVNLADLLALEAIRVLKPQTFDRLLNLSKALTYTNSGTVGGFDNSARVREQFKPQLDALVAEAGDDGEAIAELLTVVFPGSQAITGNTTYSTDYAQQWRRERRVANPEVFATYFSLALPPGAVESAMVEAVFASFNDPKQLDDVLQGLPNDRIETLLERLEDFEQDYPDDPTTAIVAIENLFPRLPRLERRGMFELDSRLRVDRVVLRLLRKAEPESRRNAIVQAVYPQLRTLTGRLWLLFLSGHRENIGHSLISDEVESELVGRLREEIRASDPTSLSDEREVLRLLQLLREGGQPSDDEAVASLLDKDEVLLGTLRSSLSENLSNSSGDITVQREAVLAAWKWLEALIGSDKLVERVGRLGVPENADEATVLTVETARRYSDGWRPRSFDRTEPRPPIDDDSPGDDDG